MNKIARPKRAWRDAATLIIAGKNGRLTASKESGRSPTQGKSSSFLQSQSSVDGPKKLVDAKSQLDSDFSILLLKRSSNSRFMPDAYVFPGGVIDQSDYSDEWSEIFGSAGYDSNSLKIYKDPPTCRPLLFNEYQNTFLGPDVAFRICALRETFEESGVLIVKPNVGEKFAGLSHEENLTWRKTVHENASMFLQLCRKFNCVPDIWSLREWSNWLTPITMSRRYDTVFYMYTVDYQPYIEQDNTETTHAMWSEPFGVLLEHLAGKLWVAPPQLYELNRLMRYNKLADLSAFAESREQYGSERWLPYRYACKDGLVGLFPGDDGYPSDPKFKEKSVLPGDDEFPSDTQLEKVEKAKIGATTYEATTEKNVEDFRSNVRKLNRIEGRSRNHFRVINNFERLGHPPLNFEVNKETQEFKLSTKL